MSLEAEILNIFILMNNFFLRKKLMHVQPFSLCEIVF